MLPKAGVTTRAKGRSGTAEISVISGVLQVLPTEETGKVSASRPRWNSLTSAVERSGRVGTGEWKRCGMRRRCGAVPTTA